MQKDKLQQLCRKYGAHLLSCEPRIVIAVMETAPMNCWQPCVFPVIHPSTLNTGPPHNSSATSSPGKKNVLKHLYFLPPTE